MTREEAIFTLENGAWWDSLNYDMSDADKNPLFDALDMAISALRAQQEQGSGCAECSGIVYRQTASGKIVPLDQRCGAKITPPCYVPDGDGCSYQIYGDNNDEPIDRCKSCPLCQSDKVRHKQEHESNDPLTLDELRQMDGEPVWIVEDPDWGHWELSVCAEDYVLERETDFYGMKYDDPDGRYGLHKLGWLAYRRKPEEGTV